MSFIFSVHADIKGRRIGVTMGKQSINEIKVLLQEDKLSDAEIMLLQSDTRKGVQQLIKAYEKENGKKQH